MMSKILKFTGKCANWGKKHEYIFYLNLRVIFAALSFSLLHDQIIIQNIVYKCRHNVYA